VRQPKWLPRLVAEAAHLDQLREHGGLPGLRDEDALEAALARARQKWTYDSETDLATLAAAYAFGLTTAHPFKDGNKRIGFLAMTILLGLNGKDLDASETEVVQVMVSLAAGSLSEAQLAKWIRDHLARLIL
jgi:death-on-curing protein